MDPREVAWLLDGLELGGANVIVHASMPSFGPLAGGVEALCRGLCESVGDDGVIVMPAYTYNATLGEQDGVVPFHADLSVNSDLGIVPEAFRRFPGVIRSSHPTHSFLAWGRRGRDVLSTQRDNNVLGPLKKLNVARGHVVLLGTDLSAASAIHLAEEQAGVPYLRRCSAWRLNSAGYDERVVIEQVPGCSVAFSRLEQMLDPNEVLTVRLAHGIGRKIAIRYLLGIAMQALRRDRNVFVCDRAQCESCDYKRRVLR